MIKYKNREGFKETKGSKQKDKYLNGFIGGKKVGMHRIVAKAFLPNPDNLPVVDHINEDKEDNRVSNLRWCTHTQNSQYYHQLPSREDRRKFLQSTQENYQDLENRLAVAAKMLTSLKEENARLQEELLTLKTIKLEEAQEFERYKERELLKISTLNSNYTGYRPSKGATFSSVTAMVEATGKHITIDGKRFKSAGSGATYIKDKEQLLGTTRNHSTISKELRRYLQGKRGQWLMYDKYSIGY